MIYPCEALKSFWQYARYGFYLLTFIHDIVISKMVVHDQTIETLMWFILVCNNG
jgi:hypothetical protein